jgi:hypothetical protein
MLEGKNLENMENLITCGLDHTKIAVVEGRNSFSLQNLDGDILEAPVNGRYLKHFFSR